MARSARERAERFAWPQVTAEVTEVYEEAVAQPQPATRAARVARNVGLTPAEPGPRVRPRRLPSLEVEGGARHAPPPRRACARRGARARRSAAPASA